LNRDRPYAAAGLNTARGKAGLLAAGGLLGALGISGAWIGAFTSLEPYQPLFLAVAAGLLAVGHRLAYRRADAACVEGEACSQPLPGRLVKGLLWAATLLVVAAAVFPYVGPALLGI
jgi:mercuric ion transport protein